MPRILCIESTAIRSSVALFTGSTLIEDVHSEIPNSHSELLATMIVEVLKIGNTEPNELEAISISSGPGSYTSLRVGASLAKGMCLALSIPLITLDSLHIAAYPHFSHKGNEERHIIPTIDARRDEAYISVFTSTGIEVETAHPHIFTDESFQHLAHQQVLICGNAAEKASTIITPRTNMHFVNDHPSAIHMGTLAYEKFKAADFADVAYFEPNYIKLPNITTPKKPLI